MELLLLSIFGVMFYLFGKLDQDSIRELKKAEPILISSVDELSDWAAKNVESLSRDRVIRAKEGEIYTFDPCDDDDCSGTFTLRMNIQMPPGDVCFDIEYDEWSKKRSAFLLVA